MSNKTNAAILIATGAVFAAVVLTVTAVASASRNSSGTMSAANGPYVAGTVINPTTINSRYSDIETEITDSLSRSGKGGMLAPLRGADGTVAAPAYSWTSETGTGFYRIGASDLGLALAGTKKHEWTASGELTVGTLGATGAYRVQAGSSGATASAFTSLLVEASGAHLVSLLSPNANNEGICFGDVANGCRGGINYFNSANAAADQMQATTGGTVRTITSNSGFAIGASGTAISGSFAASGSFTPGSIAAGSSNGTSITVTGAAAGSPCVVGTPTPNTALSLTCYVTLNSCNITLFNPTASPQTGTAGTYQCRVWNP